MARSNGKASHGVNKSIATSPPKTPAGVGIRNKSNGDARHIPTKGELKEKLQTDPLRDYHSSRFNYFGELFVQQLPLWRLWTARMMLSSDPIVNFSMNIRNAALMAAEVEVTGKKQEVVEWVQKNWDFIWNQHRTKMVSAKEFGFAPLQPLYKEDEEGLLQIKGMKDYAPEDARAREKGGRIVGCRIKGVEIYFPQAIWLTHAAKYGNAYGYAITRRQYPAWYEKWMERGAKRLQQLRMIKDAYIGDIFWYPPDMVIELPDGTKLPWRDIAREIAENRMSGGAMSLPLKYDSNGKELFKYQPPTPIPGATEIFNWVESCDNGILQGADIPYEVVQAASTGSGFSGRSIPFLVLLSVCNTELTELVQQTDEQGLRNVARLNFGGDPEYEIKPKSLVESFSADIQGSSLAGGSIGGPVRQQQDGQQGTPQAVTQQYKEIDPDSIPPHKLPWSGLMSVPSDWQHLSSGSGLSKLKAAHVSHFHHTEHINQSHVDSIKEHLQNKDNDVPPIVVEREGKKLHIVDGHHRFEAAKQLGYKHLPFREVLEHSQHSEGENRLPFSDPLWTDVEGEAFAEDYLSQQASKFKVGDGLHILGEHYKVVDFGHWRDIKHKHHEAALHALNNLPSHLKEEHLGRTWVVEHSKTGKRYAFGKAAIGLFATPSQHQEEIAPEQFAENYLTQLRRMIGRGLIAAQNRIKGTAKIIRSFDPTKPFQTLAELIEGEIRRLSPYLGIDLTADTLPSHVHGTLEVLGRLPSTSTPYSLEGSKTTPTTPSGTLSILPTLPIHIVPEPPPISPVELSPAQSPIMPELREILFGPEVKPEVEVHLSAIEAAVEALDKSPVAVGSNYLETAQKVKEGSFAITGDLTEKAVADVREQLSKVILEGKPQAEFIETVAKRLDEAGSPLSPNHLETIFRTSTMAAYSKAQAEAVQHPMVADAFPYVSYSATMDARVREEHWALEFHGLNRTNIYRYDDPTFKKFRPPWSWNCRCHWVPQTVEQAAKKGVEEAKAWLDRAKAQATAQGGSFYQYLNNVAPAVGERVQPPPFEPDPAFKRDLVG